MKTTTDAHYQWLCECGMRSVTFGSALLDIKDDLLDPNLTESDQIRSIKRILQRVRKDMDDFKADMAKGEKHDK